MREKDKCLPTNAAVGENIHLSLSKKNIEEEREGKGKKRKMYIKMHDFIDFQAAHTANLLVIAT